MITDRIYSAFSAFPRVQAQLKRVLVRLPHRLRKVDHFGQQLWVDPSELHGFYLYYEREYDDPVFDFLEAHVAAYSRVLDIGANMGIYTVFFGARVRRVDAFEPDSDVAEQLRRNLALNSLTNVTVHETCVSEVSGEVDFSSPGPVNRGVGRIAIAGGAVDARYPAVSLDDYLPDPCPEPTLIKLDVEGAEWLAVRGAGRVLASDASRIDLLIEVHREEIREYGGSVSALRRQLTDLGYRVCGLEDGRLRHDRIEAARFWWVTRPLSQE